MPPSLSSNWCCQTRNIDRERGLIEMSRKRTRRLLEYLFVEAYNKCFYMNCRSFWFVWMICIAGSRVGEGVRNGILFMKNSQARELESCPEGEANYSVEVIKIFLEVSRARLRAPQKVLKLTLERPSQSRQRERESRVQLFNSGEERWSNRTWDGNPNLSRVTE